jgi:hypothetical protein
LRLDEAFTWGDRVYIGQSENLQRRFSHDRNPGPNQRINAILLPLLHDEGHAHVATMSAVQVSMADNAISLDLENAALVAARLEGRVEIENL